MIIGRSILDHPALANVTEERPAICTQRHVSFQYYSFASWVFGPLPTARPLTFRQGSFRPSWHARTPQARSAHTPRTTQRPKRSSQNVTLHPIHSCLHPTHRQPTPSATAKPKLRPTSNQARTHRKFTTQQHKTTPNRDRSRRTERSVSSTRRGPSSWDDPRPGRPPRP